MLYLHFSETFSSHVLAVYHDICSLVNVLDVLQYLCSFLSETIAADQRSQQLLQLYFTAAVARCMF